MDATARRLVKILHELLDVDELEDVLRRILTAAQELTGAQYAALGVLNEEQDGLARFLTVGIDEAQHAEIGELPHGRGVLGELITHPRVLRLDDVSQHPRSYGFPLGHPPMRTFLGAPIVIRGEVYGNIYLTEKPEGAEFTEDDEELLSVLAEYAAIGIHHVRRVDRLEGRRSELERTVSALSATSEISRALAGEVDLDPTLQLVAKRGRALVAARTLVIFLPDNGCLRVVQAVGEVPGGLLGESVSAASTAGNVLGSGRPQRLSDELNRSRFSQYGLGSIGLEAQDGLYVPMMFRGRSVGVLAAFDRLVEGPSFTSADEQLLTSFATTAAAAVATAQAITVQRQRERTAAAEAERRRWARELHDETLQGIAAVRVMLGAARRGGEEELRAAVAQAADDLQDEVDRLRAIVHDVRPSSLDDLGLRAAMEALVARHATKGPALRLDVDLDWEADRASERLDPDIEIAIYRIAQEAITNALKHADATTIHINVADLDGEVGVRVRDDGRGFDPSAGSSGFGMHGMQERVDLLDGRLSVHSEPGVGTTVEARLPGRRREPEPFARTG